MTYISFKTTFYAFVCASLVNLAYAAPIAVPNGNFTATANQGSIGSVLGSANNISIGSGPWNGNYQGILSLALAPGLSISTTGGAGGGGYAQISGITSLNVLGSLAYNSGSFYQSISGSAYQANTTYTLTANVDVGSLLSLSALSGTGFGIALTNSSGAVLSSTINPANVLSLSLLTGTSYTLSLQYATGGTSPTGQIGISLFNNPAQVANASVLGTVKFSNITLQDNIQAVPEPSSMALSIIGISALVFIRWKVVGSKLI